MERDDAYLLIHEYLRIDLAAVWDTVHDDLPPLIAQLEPLIPPEDAGS